jgi:hypothetical protein
VALKIFQAARAALESTRGTDLTPTRLLYFEEAEHQQDVATIRPQTLGSYFGWRSGASAGTEVNSLRWGGVATYDDIIWWLNTHVKAVASGTGAGADKTWTFLPSGTADDIKSAAIQIAYSDNLGASQPGARLNYALGDKFSLKWDKKGDGAVRFTSEMVVPKAAVQISAFTGSLSDRTVTPVSANSTVVTIDAATIGTTVDNYWTEATFSLDNKYRNLYTLNNTTSAQDTFRPEAREWKLEGTRYYQSDTEWDAYIAKTVRKIRIKSTGPVVGSGVMTLQLDLYGVYTEMKFVDVDGLGMQRFTLEPVFDTTAATDFQFVVINDEATVN